MSRSRFSATQRFMRNALLITGSTAVLTGGVMEFAATAEAVGNSALFGFAESGYHNDPDAQWDDHQDPESRGKMYKIVESFTDNTPALGYYAIAALDDTSMKDKFLYGTALLGGGLAMLYGRKKIKPSR